MTSDDLEWTAPGEGVWAFDPVHWPRPVSRVMQEVFPDASHRGWAPAFARYGVPVDGIRMAFCNDHLYLRVAPVTEATELERRDAAAARSQDHSAWVDDAARWERELRPARRAANFALQDVDPSSLDDAALARHLEAAIANMAAGTTEHFSLVEVAGQGVGRLLDECGAWGIAADEAMALLAGCSPGSSDAAHMLSRLRDLVPVGGAQPRSLADVRAVSGEVALTLDAFLREHGWRILTGYDVEDSVLAEHEDVIVRTLGAASALPAPSPTAAVDAHGLRAQVPAGDRPRFDRVVEDARATYGVRDDNEGLTLMWPTGLVRRALLETGRRLASRDLLLEPAHIFVAGRAELQQLLSGGGPGANELAARQARRELAAMAPPPSTLDGGATPEPPEPGLHAGRAMAALNAAFAAEWDTVGHTTVEGVVGVGVGTGTRVGKACVAPTLDEALALLGDGDILITPLTSSAFNAVLLVAGALVTEEGGPFCHAAIVARELGLPAVIGAKGAMATINSGDDVLVDADAGTVKVLRPVGPASR